MMMMLNKNAVYCCTASKKYDCGAYRGNRRLPIYTFYCKSTYPCNWSLMLLLFKNFQLKSNFSTPLACCAQIFFSALKFQLLILKASGILIPMYILVRLITAIQNIMRSQFQVFSFINYCSSVKWFLKHHRKEKDSHFLFVLLMECPDQLSRNSINSYLWFMAAGGHVLLWQPRESTWNANPIDSKTISTIVLY